MYLHHWHFSKQLPVKKYSIKLEIHWTRKIEELNSS